MSAYAPDEKLTAICVSANATISDAMAAIDRGAIGIALVVDEQSRLVGTVTDGDIRRALLRGLLLTAPVSEVMNAGFASVPQETSPDDILALMRRRTLRHMPVVDREGRVVRLARIENYASEAAPTVSAVIFAGGLGTRLRPLTDDSPKPMLEVGGVPILELIVRQLALSGITDIIITTHYRAEAIESHFENGQRLGVRVRYLREQTQQGTAGSLRIVRDMVPGPVVVSMGDVLTNLNFANMLHFHRETRAELTVGVCRYKVAVPFGVLNVSSGRVLSVDEKPDVGFLINSGLYVVEHSALDLLPEGDGPCDMTDLINDLVSRQRHVVSFPIEEHWMDIGREKDLQRAIQEAEVWGRHLLRPRAGEESGP